MNAEQISLARHALGLPNRSRRSYRNHFCTGPGSTDYALWQQMVEGGFAKRRPGNALTGGDDLFRLTRKGAQAALQGREKLSEEDFPMAVTRGVLFSGVMVQALLDSRKTQTRRLATSPLAKSNKGDLLWVREAHYLTDNGDFEVAVYAADAAAVADHLRRMDNLGRDFPEAVRRRHIRLRPAMHMPRWASRITLEVTDVRLQPLHEISEEDALAEGVIRFADGRHVNGLPDMRDDWKATARQSYADLWVRLHGDGSWRSNPEVVAVTFIVHQKNVDELLREREG